MAGYGSDVTGLDNREMLALQRMEAKFITPRVPGRSLKAALLVWGSSSDHLATAALVRWSREVWDASTFRRPRGLTIAQCHKASQACNGPEPTWAKVNGPISAAI